MKKAGAATMLAVLLAVCLALCLASLSGCSDDGKVSASSTPTIVINEVMTSNDVFYPAANGRCYDWVELRNLTGEALDLGTCYLTDDERAPKQYKLEGLTIPPNGYACVYLSGLAGIDVNGCLHANFKLSSLGETLILNDSDGVVLSMITIPESVANVSYGAAPGAASSDGEGFVWYSTPTPGAENAGEYADDAGTLTYQTNGVIINEYMIDNTYIIYDADGDYSDWLELMNPTGADVDLSGCFLSDDPQSIGKWSFPQGTTIPAGGYLMVWCSGKDKTDSEGRLHTSFALSAEDESITLSTMQGTACSTVEIFDLPENISCGYPEGSTELKLFARPTPGKANTTAPFELSSRPSPDINNGVYISETLSASAGTGALALDYIEICNATSGAVELGGYTLAQSPGEVVFTFPAMTLRAGGYLLVYCDGTTAAAAGATLRAPIKLNTGGESLYLADSSGRVVDYFETGKQYYGISSGRTSGELSVRRYFTSPTPGSANTGTWYAGYAAAPAFSREGGYTDAGTQITIDVPEGCSVRYTTDGTKPDAFSKAYGEGEAVTIDKTTVIRAISVKEGCLASSVVTATYLVEDRHDISVVCMNGAGLIDFYKGILVDGYYNNYRQGWTRDVHIEYYTEAGVAGVEFDARAEIFGQYSRSLPQKGVRLNLGEAYGASEVTYPFFTESVSKVRTFNSLLLRPCGQDYNRAKLRDEIVPAIIRGRVEVDYQEYRACALYVNGEYWGLYYIRERLDEDYLIHKYGFEEGKTDLIKSQLYEQAGTIDDYVEMQNFARNHDMTVKENYEYMCERVDLTSLCDYWIIETYFANTDTGNIRCYRTEGGKWRWMVYDFDWAMTPATYHRNYIDRHVLDPAGHGSANFSNAIIRKLLANKEFKDIFISRYCYHINTTFDADRCIEILNGMAGIIRTEIPRQAEKWGAPTMGTWEESLDFLNKFFTKKQDMAKQQLRSSFGLSESELQEYLDKNK